MRWRPETRGGGGRSPLALAALVLALGCAGPGPTPSASTGRAVTAEPAVFTGYVQVVEGEGGAPQVILSTATRDVIATGDLVDRLAALDGKRVRVEGRWIDRGTVPVLEIQKIDAP